MTIMLDTNIIISAALFPNGKAAKAFFKSLLPPFQPIVCDYIVDELHRKFREKWPDRTVELEAFLYNALSIIEVVPTPSVEILEEKRFAIQRIAQFSEQHLTLTLIFSSQVILIFWNHLLLTLELSASPSSLTRIFIKPSV